MFTCSREQEEEGHDPDPGEPRLRLRPHQGLEGITTEARGKLLMGSNNGFKSDELRSLGSSVMGCVVMGSEVMGTQSDALCACMLWVQETSI